MSVAVVLGIVALAIVLFASERIPIELTSLALVVLLVATGLLTPAEALAGFSNETVIFIFALLAMTQGLAATGVMQLLGRRMVMATRGSPRVFQALLLVVVAAVSSVASNTAVTAAFLPVATTAAARAGCPVDRVLMPMAFSSMLGGMIFLFGTSTNLVVSAEMAKLGLGPLGFAELTPLGLPLAITGLIAILVLGRLLLRSRTSDGADRYGGGREYVAEVRLRPGSRLAGKTLAEIASVCPPVLALLHEGRTEVPHPNHVLSPEDHLIIGGTRSDVLAIRELRSAALGPDLELAEAASGRSSILAEVMVGPTSPLVGQSLTTIRLADRLGLVALAIHRHPAIQALGEGQLLEDLVRGGNLGMLPLAAGDVLLVSGPVARIRDVAETGELMVLDEVAHAPPRYGRAAVAVLIFASAVTVAGTGVASPAIVGLAGMITMVATGCLDARTAFAVDWRVVVLIASLLALGLAMETSGAAAFVAAALMPVGGWAGPVGLLCLLMIMTIVLSVPMSNQAAALVMLPIAIHMARDLGLAPRPFAIGVCLAASCSFLTPLEPSAALVYGPGHYRFADYLRVGTPLTLLMLLALTIGVPLVWGFTPVQPALIR